MIQQLFFQFLEEKKFLKNPSPKTIEWYLSVYNSLKIPETLKLEELRSFIISDLQKAQSRGVKPVSLNCTIRWYNSFINWCIEQEHIPPSTKWKIKQIPTGRPTVKHLTDEDIKKLKSAKISHEDFLRYRTHTAVLLMLYTGLRMKEIRNLTMQNIDLTNKVIYVSNTKNHRDRLAYLVESIRPRFVTYLTQRAKKFPDSEWVFPDRRGKQMTTSAMEQAVRKLGQELGLSIKLSPHKLRHTFCIMAIEAGADISQVAKLAGHSNIGVTQVYLEFSKERLASIAERFIRF